MREPFEKRAQRTYENVQARAEKLAELMDGPAPDDRELQYHWDGNRFSVGMWLSSNDHSTDHDIMLGGGGPACGVTEIHGHPYFWYQDWGTEKWTKALTGKAAVFYERVFQYKSEVYA